MDGDRVLRLGHRLAELNRQKRFDSVDHSVEAETARYAQRDEALVSN